ncbi:ADP-ribosylglycohydrolase family protein [Stenomitos frigidus]|uniref:ADP-ribosylglycohydrolase family protein n=1 Tax=Stenomitos frigidus ULC18 TaxID=2107698 RepID=A0A2T1E638_9CYAN|nr:ADP-ribosylglycohydrolase family protein [Stenomitos frigidus]PSB28114.1 hypothetical protein C7B82_14805 [Stenomitos frigidus ULC18]
MRYSLLSRFQGTLLAAALGDALGAYSRLRQPLKPEGVSASNQEASPLAPVNLAAWHPGIMPGGSASSTPSTPWGNAAISCARVLVQAGRWNELEMAAIGVRLAADRMAMSAVLDRPHSPIAFIAAESALAMLPVTLFFHDNEPSQQQRLVQTANLWRCPPGTEAGALAFSYAIAQLLQDRLDRLALVPQTVAYLKQSTANPTALLLDLMHTLEQAQTLLQQGAGLHMAIEQLRARATHLDSRAIALAFYCFLSTPNDLTLSLLRAARSGVIAPVVCALTGALSGAYNSLNGLPLAWSAGSPMPLLWGLSDQEMNQLVAHLFAVWSGVYDTATATNRFAIAAPGVIRPR